MCVSSLYFSTFCFTEATLFQSESFANFPVTFSLYGLKKTGGMKLHFPTFPKAVIVLKVSKTFTLHSHIACAEK